MLCIKGNQIVEEARRYVRPTMLNELKDGGYKYTQVQEEDEDPVSPCSVHDYAKHIQSIPVMGVHAKRKGYFCNNIKCTKCGRTPPSQL